MYTILNAHWVASGHSVSLCDRSKDGRADGESVSRTDRLKALFGVPPRSQDSLKECRLRRGTAIVVVILLMSIHCPYRTFLNQFDIRGQLHPATQLQLRIHQQNNR